jgi:steroid 5-alpha reductase family enzyme
MTAAEADACRGCEAPSTEGRSIVAEKAGRGALAPIVTVLVAAGIAWAGSQGGASVAGVPVFALAIALAFLVQWLAFIPSYVFKTERYFDLIGSFTYITVMTLTVVISGATDARSVLLLILVLIWAGRLGPFLFRRVRRAGKDDRFDEIKGSFLRFFTTWTLQGLWISLTLAAALAVVTSAEPKGLDAFAVIGLVVWILGFAIEAVADWQKSRFRADPANTGDFITTGLWAWSRHPNYFGEIVLWTGVAIIALPILSGWRLLTLISPVFVYLLLTRVSGVPLLEKKADAKWGGQEAYEAYKRQTPVLVPLLGRKGA